MKYTYAILVVSVLMFCSCQKENNDSNTGSAETTLVKFVDIDSTQPTGFDSIQICIFKYDNEKRLSEIDNRFYNLGAVGTRFHMTLFYNGSESRPYKKVRVVEDALLVFKDSVYYFYTNAVLTGDSIVYGDSKEVNTYTYETGKIIHNRKNINSLGQVTNSLHNIFYTKSGGNTLLETYDNYSWNASYDNHPNPYYGLMDIYGIGNEVYFKRETFLESTFRENNNVLHSTESENGSHREMFYSYQYRENGYPEVMSYHDDSDPTFVIRRKFYYTAL